MSDIPYPDNALNVPDPPETRNTRASVIH